MIFETLSEMTALLHVLKQMSCSVYLLNSDSGLLFCTDPWQYPCPRPVPFPLSVAFDAQINIFSDESGFYSVARIPVTVKKCSCVLILVHYSAEKSGLNFAAGAEWQGSAFIDFLTQLYNRQYIDLQIPLDIRGCLEHDQPLSLLFLDIDYFKTVNDKNGHIAGDHVLQGVAALLKRQLADKNGWVARYGGDEFLICLPGWESDPAKQIAYQIRDSIRGHVFRFNGAEVAVTCSIGVKTLTAEYGLADVQQLILLADQKLYQAKNAGRDQVM